MTSLFQRLARPGFAVIATAWLAGLTVASATAVAAQATESATATASLLPAVATSQSFIVATKVQTPFHGGQPGGRPPDGASGQGGPPGGPPPGGSPPSGAGPPGGYRASFGHDESGTLMLSRTTNDSVRVTTGGDLDTLDASFAIDTIGAVSASSPPNKYIVAFDNATAIAAKQTTTPKPGDTWDATAQIQTFGGEQTAVPIAVKVVSVSDGLLTLAATGSASITISTPRGDRPADLAIGIDMQVASGKLRSYAQKLAQTMKTPRRTITLDATTTLTAK